MRLTAFVAILMVSGSSLAFAQDRVPVERRVDSLERQMRSVQRKVFQPGSQGALEADAPAAAPAANAAISDLTQRVDALERQLTVMTGEVEENGNRIRALEETAKRTTDAFDSRLDRLEAGGLPSPSQPASGGPSVEPDVAPAAAPSGPAPGSEPDAPSADPAENAYLEGYRLWEAKRYGEAVATLKSTATKYAKHRRASWARNLMGRAYLDDNKPATAAEAFLSNYQDLPKGERAPDSLYFLGAALMKLNKPEQACKVYDELTDVYGAAMRDFLKQNLPAARKQAKCG